MKQVYVTSVVVDQTVSNLLHFLGPHVCFGKDRVDVVDASV